MSAHPVEPGWEYEHRASSQGFSRVAGLDEVGRGSLAGPVVVAAVILKPGRGPDGVRDSKLLTPKRRAELIREILRQAEAWGVGAAAADEIDRINILNATHQAMKRAIDALPGRPDHLLIDALELDGVDIEQTSIIKGDRICMSIAAASILAKVVRDRVMDFYDRLYPGFSFAEHKGYGTAEHLQAIDTRGPCAIHRRTFKGVWREIELPFGPGDSVPVSRS